MSLDIWLYYPSATTEGTDATVIDLNITHNLTPMWRLAGCYDALYMSVDREARTISPALEEAVRRMKVDPAAYVALNPPNGWGSYEDALPWLERLLVACKAHPSAIVGVSK